MEAIVLAGGFGTRLRSVVSSVPKPMADIGGKPFMGYVLDHLEASGVGRVVLSVGYLNNVISGFFKDRYKGIDIVYSVEDEPLGTGGALRGALNHIHGEDVFVLNGDTLFMADLGMLRKKHREKNVCLTMSLKPMSCSDRYGSVIEEDGFVTGFMEKATAGKGLINGGVYCVRRDIRRFFSGLGDRFSLERDFLMKMTLPLAACLSDAYFIDIGIPEDYERAKMELAQVSGGVE